MKQYSEFSALWRAAIFQKSFYQDVARNWRGVGARYLLLLAMLTWAIVLVQWTINMSVFLQHEAPEALKDFPTIHIVKGVASSDVEQPYIMRGDRDEPLFVLDTTGKTKLPTELGARMLLTDRELIQVDALGRVQRQPLSQFPDTTIDKEWILSWIRLTRNGLIPAGLLGCGGFSEAYRILLALLFAAIGKGFNSLFKGGLDFRALMRLSIVAMTGPVWLDTLLWILHVPFTCGILMILFHLFTLGYLIYAIKVAAEVVPARATAQPFMPSRPGMPPPPLPQKPGSDLFP